MARPDPRRSRALLVAGAVALFALSGVADPAWLLAAWMVALGVYRRGAPAALRRVAIAVVPLAAVTAGVTWAWLSLTTGAAPRWEPFAALGLRTTLLAFVAFSTLARVDLPGALAPWPSASRVLVIALSQLHALRRVVIESREGLKSRSLGRPRLRDAVRGAGGLTATLFTLAARNARETTEALRSRELG